MTLTRHLPPHRLTEVRTICPDCLSAWAPRSGARCPGCADRADRLADVEALTATAERNDTRGLH